MVDELIEYGTRFDMNSDGNFDLAKEGGHTENRILHHKDITGWEIERALVETVKKHQNIEIFENHFAIDLITQHHLGFTVTRYMDDIECYGAYVLDTSALLTLRDNESGADVVAELLQQAELGNDERGVRRTGVIGHQLEIAPLSFPSSAWECLWRSSASRVGSRP